jgi:poly-gamma-glutamate synthesis protein (capsule biosynthesis protein)
MDRPNPVQKNIAQQFVKAGASLVIGHHPHVVQGIEKKDNTLIAYSLGNFIFDGNLEATSWSAILSITISGQKILASEAVPVIKDRDCRPVLAEGERKDQLQKEIMRRCLVLNHQFIDAEKYQKEYLSELKTLDAKSRRRLWLDITKKFFHYKPIYWPQILLRPIRRRLGIW